MAYRNSLLNRLSIAHGGKFLTVIIEFLLYFLFMRALLLSILTPLFLPSSSVSLSFILAVPMLKCLGKRLCMSSPIPIAILNDNFFFCETR